jgi:hypothetical protein
MFNLKEVKRHGDSNTRWVEEVVNGHMVMAEWDPARGNFVTVYLSKIVPGDTCTHTIKKETFHDDHVTGYNDKYQEYKKEAELTNANPPV